MRKSPNPADVAGLVGSDTTVTSIQLCRRESRKRISRSDTEVN